MRRKTMLSALLETIGILGLLVSLAVNFGKRFADAKARDARNRPGATILAFPPIHGNRPPADSAGEDGNRHGCEDEQAMDHDAPVL
jgi:hypothetical protein